MSSLRRSYRRFSLVVAPLMATALLTPLSVGSWGAADPLRPAGCPARADAGNLMSQEALYQVNRTMADAGARPTATPAHKHFVSWLDRRMTALPGMQVQSVPYAFTRWEPVASRIRLANDRTLRVAAPIPYSRSTGARGISAPLTHIPLDQEIGPEARGKVVVRDFPPGSVPSAVFAALQWWEYDPDLTLTQGALGNYEREWLSAQAPADLKAAEEVGVAGLVFVHELPADQLADFYNPYGGERWRVPAVRVGVDEGEHLKRAASAGERVNLVSEAREGRDATRTVIATLPGVSEERLVVTSHTDGMNAAWDNGPVAMAALAEHFAGLPLECRPRTLQFIFTTGHLYMGLQCASGSKGPTALCVAEELDKDYDAGQVAAVLAIEHLGARNFEAVPRESGLPGKTLVPTGLNEPNSFFIGESPALSEAVLRAVVSDDLRGTIALRGADAPGPHLPVHHSFGGEGGAYHSHLVPTIAFVTGSRTLFGTGYTLEQLVDPALLHQQTRVFADILHHLETLPREVLAGGYLAQRGARAAVCGIGVGAAGLVDCGPVAPGSASSPEWAEVVTRLQHVH